MRAVKRAPSAGSGMQGWSTPEARCSDILDISWRHWWDHSDRRRQRKTLSVSLLEGRWYTKPGLPFSTSGSSCMADYSINGAALAQGEVQNEKTKQEQRNNYFLFLIACDFMWSDSWFCILSSPPPYLVSPQSYYPLILDCSCHPGNPGVHVDFFFNFLIVLRQRKLEITPIKVKAMQRDAVSLSLFQSPLQLCASPTFFARSCRGRGE